MLHIDGVAKIEWYECVNASWADFDSYVTMSLGSVSVDADNLNSTFNSTARITMYNLDMNYPRILSDGDACMDCVILSWKRSTGTAVFNVSGFSEYNATEANQSKVDNNFTGNTNVSIYLLMQVEYWNETQGGLGAGRCGCR